ncbi:MAG: hypothetical protein ACOCXG_05330 [Nanoarchaeota archaeon]
MQFNKKGFGGAVSTLIMFIAIISVTTGLVMVFQNYVFETQNSINAQNKITSSKLRTAVAISNTYYNSSSDVLEVYVKNIGDTNLVSKNFDVYLDNQYILNFSFVEPSSYTGVTLLTPQKTGRLIINNSGLNSGSHIIKLVTEYGVDIEEYFNT